MPTPVNRRSYRSALREEAATRTRAQIIAAARDLFTRDGYQQTAMSAVADLAGVSLDTVYTAVGRKPALVRVVMDDILGEGGGPITATDRQYVQRIRAATGATNKLTLYAQALGRIQPRLAPLAAALRDAGALDKECAEAWQGLIDRRAANMRLLVADLRATGELRADLDDESVADLIWATNSPEYFLLLTSRGWSAQRYTDHLVDLWPRLLLRSE